MSENPKTEEIVLPRPLINRLLHHAQTFPGLEICGLIGANEDSPTTCYPIENIADDQSHRFVMDPHEQIDAMRKIRDNHEELFAIYHSHPSSPAQPSTTDLELAEYPDTLQLIISLKTKGVLEMRGFRLNGKKSVQEVILTLASE